MVQSLVFELFEKIRGQCIELYKFIDQEDPYKSRTAHKNLTKSIDKLEKVVKQELTSTAEPPAVAESGTPTAVEPRIPEKTNPMRISDFFETVGDGVVAAQEQLDQRSKNYIENKPDVALPSLFRIPKASAEIHFAIETIQEKKFNVVVYGAGEKRQQQQQHKVSFDIIAAPPPPDLLNQIKTPLVREAFVTGRAVREKLRVRLRAYAERVGENTEKGRHALGIVADEIFPRILILRSDEFWALILPKTLSEPQKSYTMDVSYLWFDEPKDPQFYGRWPPTKRVDKRFDYLVQLFLALSEDQAKRSGDG